MPNPSSLSAVQYCAILLSNEINKNDLIDNLLSEKSSFPLAFIKKNGIVFSDRAIKEIMIEEERHDLISVARVQQRKLKSFSSGERKKLFLEYCLEQKPDFLILDNPLDHLDVNSRKLLKELLKQLKQKVSLVQLTNRSADILDFINIWYQVDEGLRNWTQVEENTLPDHPRTASDFSSLVTHTGYDGQELIRLEDISLAYGEKRVLRNISWTISPSEFWQLIGPNGSGKSSLLALITGDNVKGYGQDVYLFGKKKGSGESVWDIKKKIGYFSVAVLDLFKSDDKAVDMVLSGFYDSIGLYVKPTDLQYKTAMQWLSVAGLKGREGERFSKLSEGGQRIVLILRAVVKNPPLVLLDEPLEGLDEQHAFWVIRLINDLVEHTTMTVVYISHRSEPGLKAAKIFELVPGKNGSWGKIPSF